jgi:hypothetical protein
MDLRSFIDYVNGTLSIDTEYRRIFGKNIPSGKFFCPFHVNTNTPAAKRYFNGIKCFSCNRFYTVYDLLYAYDRKRLDDLKGSAVIEPVERQDRQPQKRIRIVECAPNERMSDVLNKIITKNEIQ